MKFTREQLDLFQRLSRDQNPLHADVDYARRSQFGQRVMYGVCAIFVALGRWAKGRPFRLEKISAEFRRPLFLETEYELDLAERDGAVTARYRHGGTLQAKIVFTAKLTEARGRKTRDEMGEVLGLESGQLPSAQLNALAWTSYTVGMEYPGRQALFSGLEMTFAGGASDAPFTPGKVERAFDERTNEATLTGSASGVESFLLRAFQRPEPVEYPLGDVATALGAGAPRFDGKSILITGAGRGFGAVLAKSLALQGARVALVCRDAAAAEARETIKQLGEKRLAATVLSGDLARESDCVTIAEKARAALGSLDIVIHNAFPHIDVQPFLEQPAGELERYVASALALVTNASRAFLPLLSEHGRMIAVSSSMFRTPAAGFSHYIAAKGAVEGLMRSLSAEKPALGFVVARPPRMLTDQTNVAFQRSKPESAAAVAARFLKMLASLAEKPNYQEFDL
jgi:NAD(P)-dependent dehydrogenase (short-subunit alcohol dehydrogenase family)